jgi:protein-S-isoprenylcysteine O-methyltransferase Ste14
MQLTDGGPDNLLASPTEAALGIATCLLASAGLVTAWLLGRRLPQGWGPRVRRPRDAGLMLALLVAGSNLFLAAVLRGRVSRGAVPWSHELRWFGPVWCLLVVPAQLAAAYCKGRASIPFPGVSRLSRSTGPGTGPPLSSL